MTMKTGRIVLVDDDPGLLRLLSIRLRSEGYEVRAVSSAAAAMELIPFFRPGLVITDLRMEHTDGLALLEMIQRSWPGLPVVLITAHGSIPDAVAATRNGAFGFLTKPIDKSELLDHVSRALRLSAAAQPDENWRRDIVARSAIMTERLAQAHLIAQKQSRVLITGPSGSGKGVLAEAIHRASSRADKPFAAVNCSAMPENMLESELFGHTTGAFDGADSDRVGLFQSTDGGSLLLDEIGDMPVRLQVKLLRVVEEGQVRPVGGAAPVRVDVRLISATRHDPETVLGGGRFREDLFYRLSESTIELPPLSQRRSDIPLLAAHFLRQTIDEGDPEPGNMVYAPEALDVLLAADWPGNVRQLRNVVRQIASMSTSPVISAALVQECLGDTELELRSLAEARDEFTRRYLSDLLTITRGNVSQAARMAQRNRTNFYKLLARHHIDPDNYKYSSS